MFKLNNDNKVLCEFFLKVIKKKPHQNDGAEVTHLL